MLLEFISHSMALDLNWIVSLIAGNIHWLFALFAYAFISGSGKKPAWHFLVLVGLLWAILDAGSLLGLVFAPLIISVPIIMCIRIFLENTTLQKHTGKIVVSAFFFLAFVNTFCFRLL